MSRTLALVAALLWAAVPASSQTLPDDVSSRLTEREREVARLIAAGYRVRQVGERLYLSQNTVRNHLKNIFSKLGVSSQPALIALINEPVRHARQEPAST